MLLCITENKKTTPKKAEKLKRKAIKRLAGKATISYIKFAGVKSIIEAGEVGEYKYCKKTDSLVYYDAGSGSYVSVFLDFIIELDLTCII